VDTAANMSERSRPIERASVTAADADRAAALAEGLSELELPFRATLELRYRRGLPDSTIAAVAQLEEPEIVRQRSRALVWLAQRAGIEGPDAIDAVESGLTLLWGDGPAAEPEPPAEEPETAVLTETEAPPEPEAEPEPEALPEPEPDVEVPPEPEARAAQMPLTESVPPPSVPPPGSRTPAAPLPMPRPFPSPRSKPQPQPKKISEGGSNRRLIGLLALAAAVVVLFIVITSGGSDDATTGGAATATKSNTKGSKGDKPTSDAVTMQMLPGVDVAGSIDVTMSGDPATPDLDMKLDGLPDPDGEYRAWLYKSVIDSRSLGRARKGDGEVKVTLPEGWQDYPFVDVSVQDPGSIAHSGKSISRISTADLPQP
jgi:hypothetical protein